MCSNSVMNVLQFHYRFRDLKNVCVWCTICWLLQLMFFFASSLLQFCCILFLYNYAHEYCSALNMNRFINTWGVFCLSVSLYGAFSMLFVVVSINSSYFTIPIVGHGKRLLCERCHGIVYIRFANLSIVSI